MQKLAKIGEHKPKIERSPGDQFFKVELSSFEKFSKVYPKIYAVSFFPCFSFEDFAKMLLRRKKELGENPVIEYFSVDNTFKNYTHVLNLYNSEQCCRPCFEPEGLQRYIDGELFMELEFSFIGDYSEKLGLEVRND